MSTPVCSGSTDLRRFTGPEAVELAILCRPAGPSAEQQAESAYRSLAAALAAERASFTDLSSETLFFRDIRRDLPRVLGVRARVLGTGAALPAFVEQPPADPDHLFELAATAVVPRDRSAWSVRDEPAAPACSCDGCRYSAARLVRLGGQTSLHSTIIYGTGGDAREQAANMFAEADRLLDRCGMDFRDVVRTWIYLRDIDRDYAALNAARRAFYARHGITPPPASTGVQGGPLPTEHDVCLRLHAIRSARPLARTPMSTPTLNEAWSYGADFSRGLAVVDAGKRTLHVSGTASIDAAGRTAHPGDCAAQAERMLHNIATLLAGQQASFADVVSAVVYLKHPADAPALRALFRQRGFTGFPCAVLEAPLCRPELLCEAEVVAMRPIAAGPA